MMKFKWGVRNSQGHDLIQHRGFFEIPSADKEFRLRAWFCRNYFAILFFAINTYKLDVFPLKYVFIICKTAFSFNLLSSHLQVIFFLNCKHCQNNGMSLGREYQFIQPMEHNGVSMKSV